MLSDCWIYYLRRKLENMIVGFFFHFDRQICFITKLLKLDLMGIGKGRRVTAGPDRWEISMTLIGVGEL